MHIRSEAGYFVLYSCPKCLSCAQIFTSKILETGRRNLFCWDEMCDGKLSNTSTCILQLRWLLFSIPVVYFICLLLLGVGGVANQLGKGKAVALLLRQGA